MSTTVKDLLSAARAAVPAIAPAAAADLMTNSDALVLDVRDGTEVAASGKVKGALAVTRGMLEFRADPAVPTFDPALRKDRTVLVYCASGGRSALAGKTSLIWASRTCGIWEGSRIWSRLAGRSSGSDTTTRRRLNRWGRWLCH